jgi:inorganic pyrophosphatase
MMKMEEHTLEKKYIVEAFIEIPKGAQNKYEFDELRGRFRLDRVLYSPVHYPADYGFIPDTLAEDGDALDILVLISNPTFPGCSVPARVVGALSMQDDKGVDTKILSVAAVDPRLVHVRSYRDLQPHLIKEVEYFFRRYKELEEKVSQIGAWAGAEQAITLIETARARWKRKNTGH